MYSRKAQTSIEFLVVLSFILIFTFYFISSVFNTTDINYAVHSVKNKTLQLISTSNSDFIIPKIDYSVQDNNLFVTVNLQKIDTNSEPIISGDYNTVVSDIMTRSKFGDVKITINYLN